MSEESPQKGWDSWFGAPPNPPEPEPPEPAESTPTQAPEPQRQPQLELQPEPQPEPERPAAPATPSAPAPVQASVPAVEPPAAAAPPAVEPPPVEPPVDEQPSEPEPEPQAGQADWTVPLLGAVLEGREPDAQETQVADRAPSPDAERTRIAYRRPDAEATQFVSPSASSPAPASPAAAAPTEAVPAQPPSGRVPSPGRRAPSGYSRPAGNPAAAQSDEAASAPPPASAAEPTSVVPPTPAAPPASEPAAPAPAWQAPQPALMWGEAADSGRAQPPSPAREPTRQVQQQPAAWPGNAGNAVPPQRSGAEDEWAGWDDEPARRRPEPGSPATAAAAAATASGADGGPRPRSRRKFAVMGGGGAVVIIGLVLALVLSQGGGTKGAAAAPSGFQPSGTSPAGDAQQTAAAFLAAWQSGDLGTAARYTDDPTAAQTALTSYKDGLNLAGLQLTTQSATANTASAPASPAAGSTASASAAGPSGTVTFGVSAKVGLPAASTASGSTSGASTAASAGASSAAGSTASTGSAGSASAAAPSVTANWTYTSKLTAYEKNGGWWIEWNPALVAPNLTAGEKIVSVEVPPAASEVTDSAGNDLSGATDPGVRNIANALEKSAPTGQGTPGVEIELQGANGQPIANTTDQLSKPVNTGVVKTTFSPTAEAAALSAVADHADSSMVIIQPTTGDILAVANNDGDNDFALTARVAPGSTNKIITSTALLTSGLVSSPSQAVECPENLTIDGDDFKNDSGESTPPSTPFLDDFAMSCNDAFARWYNQIGDTTLAQTAQKYYGLNEQWNLGLGAAGPYYDIPSSASNGELAQELFGQGQLEASPLAMASVAATVDTGDFKQPIVVPGQAQTSATPLPSNVQQDLQQLMKAVVYQSDGTAYNLFNGVNSTVYGKTGTADVGASQQKPNSWMVVFDPTLNVAIGCVVLDAGYGASYAAPEEAKALEALQ